MILIVGASGKVGKGVARWALKEGHKVRCISRDPKSRLADLEQEGAEVVKGDLGNIKSLNEACQDVTHVVATAHSLLGRGRRSSAIVDDRGHRDLVDAAYECGVKHFIYVSAYGAEIDHPSKFYRFKYKIERYLTQSRVPYTIIRPTYFMETHVHEHIVKPILEKNKVKLYGKGKTIRNFVHSQDVTQLIAHVLTHPETVGKTINIGGPEENNMTTNDVVELVKNMTNTDPKVHHVSRMVLNVLPKILKPFHPGRSQYLCMALYYDTHDEPFDTKPLLTEYPLTLTKLEPWLKTKIKQ